MERAGGLEATALDRRFPPMINFASEVLVPQQRFEEAATYTAKGVEIDPLYDLAWVLRTRYYLGIGDLPAAEEAKFVQALYPEGSAIRPSWRRWLTTSRWRRNRRGS